MDSTNNQEFGRSIFVCSKPLQFFNCASIVREYKITKPTIYVVTKNISEKESFKNYIGRSIYNKLFVNIFFFDTHKEVACNISTGLEYDSLFIECDRLANYQVYSPLKTKYLSVFEEGFGTYAGGPDGSLIFIKWLKWKIYSLLTGSGVSFGYGKKTDYIFVTNEKLYKKLNPVNSKKVLEFPSIMDEIQYDDALASVSNIQDNLCKKSKKVALILGTWGGAQGIDSKLTGKYDLVLYKAHPHDNSPLDLSNVITINPVWLPAEVIIGKIASCVDEFDIYHYSSSSVFYTSRLNNVKSFDLLNNRRYEKVISS